MSNSQNLLETTAKSLRLWAGILAILFLTTMLYINISQQQSNFLTQEFSQRNETLVALASSYASPFLQTNNIISLNLLLRELVARPEILFGQISNGAGDVLTELGNLRADGLVVNQPIHFNSELIGYLKLTLNQPENNTIFISSIVFSFLTIVGWFLFCLKSTQLELSDWNQLNKQLQPLVESKATDAKQWLAQNTDKAKTGLTILNQLKSRLSRVQFDLLSSQSLKYPSQYKSVVLLHIEPLSEQNDALENQAITQKLQLWIDQVCHIYHGQRVENGNTLAFGLDSDDNIATDALCAARVLYFVSQNAFPCAISLTAGEIWSGLAFSPWPVIRTLGQPCDDLMLIHLNNDGEYILMSEALFQHAELNNEINVQINKDLIRSNGQRLEVWQLDSLNGKYEGLLRHQADRLPEFN